jgi:hypothetical protein
MVGEKSLEVHSSARASAACAERSRSVCGESIADESASESSPFSLEAEVSPRILERKTKSK